MTTGKFSYRDEDWDNFEDAKDTLDLDFEPLIKDAEQAVDFFFNNEFAKSKEILVRAAKTSMYHSLGLGVINFTEALLTFEQERMAAAAEALENCETICLQKKHKMSVTRQISKMVGSVNYNEYSAEAIHSVLVHAESTLLRSILLIFEDENLINFVRAIVKVKACYGSLKECNEISKVYQWKSDYLKLQFETGVKAGLGCFNLLLSMLPKKIIKLVELVGFSADRKKGLQMLEEGLKANCTRAKLCYLALLTFHLMNLPVYTHGEGDLDFTNKMLVTMLKEYPDGMVFSMYKARHEFMKGNFEDSQKWYIKSWKSQDMWPHFHHISFWELMWLNLVTQDYKASLVYIDYLVEQSKWSKTIYLFIKGSLMIALKKDTKEIEEVMKQVPLYKKKMAGKSVPTEKFLINRSKQYLDNKWLFLPQLEVLYIYNIFKIVGKDVQVIQATLKLIDQELKDMPANIDGRCLGLLMKGTCLAYLNSPLQAEECFREIIENEKKLKENAYTVAFAYGELAIMESRLSNYEKSMRYVEIAKKKNSGFTLENKLNYKLQSLQVELSDKLN